MGQGDSKQKKKSKHKSDSNDGNAALSSPDSDDTCVLPPGPFVNNTDFVTAIPDEATWLTYKHEPTDRSFAHVQVVKVVVPVSRRVRSEHDIFFIQSDKWVFHWHFTRDILRDPGSQDLRTFNDLNYQQETRDFVCLTVTKYLDQDMYSFELAARDSYSLPKVIAVYKLLKEKLYFGDKLRYRPLSKLHEGIVSGASETELPVIASDTLFGGVKYQPLTIGFTYGYLRLVREGHEEEDVDKARWNDILLCESIPNDLPVIAGLITSVLQTPLCHVALLCGNRGTPNIAQVGASEDPNLIALLNQPVKLTVRVSEFTIVPSTAEHVDAWQKKVFEKLRKGVNISLGGDISPSELIKFRPTMAMSDMEQTILKKCIGAKALNCLELARKKVGSDLMHSSFVIPYHYYYLVMDSIFEKETSRHGASKSSPSKSPKTLMSDFMADAAANASPDPKDYPKSCAAIRELITSYYWQLEENESGDVLDETPQSIEEMLNGIFEELALWHKSGLWDRCDGIIFRSSTNAEDIEGFNAAGLYESLSVTKAQLGDLSSSKVPSEAREAVMRAILNVFASVWNFRGFEERRLFGLDSKQVRMAILCQPLFSTTQRCNGVAVTAHPTRHDFPGCLINVQKAGLLVTDSCAGTRPEQHVVWMYGRNNPVIETICLSSVMDGQALLSEEEVAKLAPLLLYLDDQFGHNTPGTSSNLVQGNKKTRFCVDVEFLVMKDTSEVVILQCRPYKMVYEFDHKRNTVTR
jgi:hypothetical protein